LKAITSSAMVLTDYGLLKRVNLGASSGLDLVITIDIPSDGT
jgi:hypothetical protein